MTELNAISGFAGARPGIDALRSAPRGFGLSLERARAASAEATSDPRAVAEEFVAASLVQPVLAQLREQNDAAAPFAPGPAEKAFGPMWDAEIAIRIARAQRFGLVDAVARNLLKQRGAMGAPEATPDAG